MDTIMNAVPGVTDWSFLNEPLYRWFIFIGALLAMGFAWNGIIDLMK